MEEVISFTFSFQQAHLGSLLNPGSTETGEPRMTKSQDLDDLLEVLVDHGCKSTSLVQSCPLIPIVPSKITIRLSASITFTIVN